MSLSISINLLHFFQITFFILVLEVIVSQSINVFLTQHFSFYRQGVDIGLQILYKRVQISPQLIET